MSTKFSKFCKFMPHHATSFYIVDKSATSSWFCKSQKYCTIKVHLQNSVPTQPKTDRCLPILARFGHSFGFPQSRPDPLKKEWLFICIGPVSWASSVLCGARSEEQTAQAWMPPIKPTQHICSASQQTNLEPDDPSYDNRKRCRKSINDHMWYDRMFRNLTVLSQFIPIRMSRITILNLLPVYWREKLTHTPVCFGFNPACQSILDLESDEQDSQG